MKKFFIILGLSLLLAFSTFGESESKSSQILLTGASGSNVDIDGNEQFDALTDGLLVLRSMFGLTGTSLISGSVAGDSPESAPPHSPVRQPKCKKNVRPPSRMALQAARARRAAAPPAERSARQ